MKKNTVDQHTGKDQRDPRKIFRYVSGHTLCMSQNQSAGQHQCQCPPCPATPEIPYQAGNYSSDNAQRQITHRTGFVIKHGGTTAQYHHTGIAEYTKRAFGENGNKNAECQRDALPFPGTFFFGADTCIISSLHRFFRYCVLPKGVLSVFLFGDVKLYKRF